MGGLDSPEELLIAAKNLGAKAIALTDTNGLYGVPEFLKEAQNYSIKAIIGSEIRQENYSFTVLVKNRIGYQVLCVFLSKLKQSDSLSLEAAIIMLARAKENIVIFSFNKDVLLKASAAGIDCYFEMTRGFFNHKDILWTRKNNIKAIANNKVHYIEQRKEPYYRVLRAIDENCALSQVDTSGYHNSHCRLLSPKELRKYFAPYPEAIHNNERLYLDFEENWFFKGNIMPGHNGLTEKTCNEMLRKRCMEAIPRRYDIADAELLNKVHKRVNYELEIIAHKNFSSYFLNVQEMAELCEYTCGRGSSAASIVNYLLHITHVDPIAENLLFDRFMNVDRMDPPDIDVDFPSDQRDDVLNAIFEQYKGRAAMVANHNFLRDRSAVREVAKVYGVKEDEISYIMARLDRIELSGLWRKIIHTALEIEGVLRHLSVHCGGVIVTPGPIENFVPVEISAKGLPVIHWEKDQTEMAGLIKTDILGNRGLAVIRDVINQLRLSGVEDICYQKMNPQIDKKTQELFIKGNTVGVTHFESPRCQTLLKTMKDHKLSTLSIVCSIIRPAAMTQVNELLRRFHGGRFRYLHPELEKILGQTFGVMVYQEDVMRVSKALAGFTSQEGNELRKVLAKKSKNKKLKYYKDKFFNGCSQKGLATGHIEKLWDDIESFAGYSFCKPHSDSYSLVSYKSAYLKAHYPAQFMAATISNGGGFYVGNVENYLNEARRMGVVILPPDVNLSGHEYSGEQMQIRAGLKQLKGIQKKTLDKIISQRNVSPFKSFEDFLERVDPPFKDARSLVKARCFSSLRSRGEEKLTNSKLMWMVYERHAKKNGSLAPEKNLPAVSTSIPEYSKERMIYWERQYLDDFVSFPSWFLYRDLLKKQFIIPSNIMEKHVGKEIIIYGQKVSTKSVRTKHEQKMAFITFSDDAGMYNTTLFPNEYEEFRDILFLGGSFLLKGKVERDLNDVQLIVSKIQRVGEI